MSGVSLRIRCGPCESSYPCSSMLPYQERPYDDVRLEGSDGVVVATCPTCTTPIASPREGPSAERARRIYEQYIAPVSDGVMVPRAEITTMLNDWAELEDALIAMLKRGRAIAETLHRRLLD